MASIDNPAISIPSGDYVLVKQDKKDEASNALRYFKLLNLPPLEQISLGEFLKLYRLSRNLEINDATVKGSISRKLINDIEHSNHIPSRAKLEALSSRLGGDFKAFLEIRNYFEEPEG